MYEYDRFFERNWYEVCVADMARFVVRSYTEDGAMQKVDYYCEENDSLHLTPRDMLPHGSYAKPLEPFDEAYFNRLGDQIQPVRLINYCEDLPINRSSEKVQQDPSQMQLFTVNMIRGSYIYSQSS